MRRAGKGQLDMILDGMSDAELAVEYDAMMGVREIYRCELCRHQISAEESRAYGIGYDCAADLGRRVWAERHREERAAEVVERVLAADDPGGEMTAGMSQVEMYAMGYTDDPGSSA